MSRSKIAAMTVAWVATLCCVQRAPADECAPLGRPVRSATLHRPVSEAEGGCLRALPAPGGPAAVIGVRVCGLVRRCVVGRRARRWFARVRLPGDPEPWFVPAQSVDTSSFSRAVPDHVIPETPRVDCQEAAVASTGSVGFVTERGGGVGQRIVRVERLKPGSPALACDATEQLVRVLTPDGALWAPRDGVDIGCRRRGREYGPGVGAFCYEHTWTATALDSSAVLRAERGGADASVRSQAHVEAGDSVVVSRVEVAGGLAWLWVEHAGGSGWVEARRLRLQGPPVGRAPAHPESDCSPGARRLRVTCPVRATRPQAAATLLQPGVEIPAQPLGSGHRIRLMNIVIDVRRSRCLEDVGPLDLRFEQAAAQALPDEGARCPVPVHALGVRQAPLWHSESLTSWRVHSLAQAAASGASEETLLGLAMAVRGVELTGHDVNDLLALGMPASVALALLAPATTAVASATVARDFISAFESGSGMSAAERVTYSEPCDFCPSDELELDSMAGDLRLGDALAEYRMRGAEAGVRAAITAARSGLTANASDRWLLASMLRSAGAHFASQALLAEVLRSGAIQASERALLGSLRIGAMEVGLPDAEALLAARCKERAESPERDLSCLLLGRDRWEWRDLRGAQAAFALVGTCPTLAARAEHARALLGSGLSQVPNGSGDLGAAAEALSLLAPSPLALQGLRAEPRLYGGWALQASRALLMSGRGDEALRLLAAAQMSEAAGLVPIWEPVLAAHRARRPGRAIAALEHLGPAASLLWNPEDRLVVADSLLRGCWFDEAAGWQGRTREALDRVERTLRLVGTRRRYNEVAAALCTPASSALSITRVLTAEAERVCGRRLALEREGERHGETVEALAPLLPERLPADLEAWHRRLRSWCDATTAESVVILEADVARASTRLLEFGADLEALRAAEQAVDLQISAQSPVRALLAPRISRLLAAVRYVPRARRVELIGQLSELPIRFSPPTTREAVAAEAAGLTEEMVAGLAGPPVGRLEECTAPALPTSAAADGATDPPFALALFEAVPRLAGCLVWMDEHDVDDEVAALVIRSTPAYRLTSPAILSTLNQAGISAQWLELLDSIRVTRDPERCHWQLSERALAE